MEESLDFEYTEVHDLDGISGVNLYVLRGGLGQRNPKAYMDNAVSEFLQLKGNPMYNEFVEIFMDNPYVRVIIEGINDLDYHPFNECGR